MPMTVTSLRFPESPHPAPAPILYQVLFIPQLPYWPREVGESLSKYLEAAEGRLGDQGYWGSHLRKLPIKNETLAVAQSV